MTKQGTINSTETDQRISELRELQREQLEYIRVWLRDYGHAFHDNVNNRWDYLDNILDSVYELNDRLRDETRILRPERQTIAYGAQPPYWQLAARKKTGTDQT